MNLIDLIKRKDRAIKFVSGEISFSSCTRENFPMQVVELSPGDHIAIDKIDEFEELKSYPMNIGWKWTGKNKFQLSKFFKTSSCSPILKISLINEEAEWRETLFSAAIDDDRYWHDIPLRWPSRAGLLRGSSLIIVCEGGTDRAAVTCLGVAPCFNSRMFLPELIKGVGVEVGPGLNPQIRPSEDVKVSYVEIANAQDWVRLYKKTDAPDAHSTEQLWERYTMSNASTLEGIEDRSLDFIFSNHVFEHLMNPLGVLENWSRKLRPMGVVYNVIPDALACFDLRQPLSTAQEWCQEYQAQSWTVDMEKYERWCAYTAPYNTPDDLIKRRYSIHVHYYSSCNAADLARIMIEKKCFTTYFIGGAWNHKDFAMILYK
jgi:hypothetical protein